MSNLFSLQFDIILVTYNSSKWINNCLNYISNLNYNLNNINIIVFDNNSVDDTIQKLEELEKSLGHIFNSFQIIKSTKNIGFGRGNNIAASKSHSEFLIFLNIDTEIQKEALCEIEKKIKQSNKQAAIWEMRQIPYEHPKYYNPVNLETTWASGACMVIRRDVFNKIKGFDKNIFMYAEDVELSWRVRKSGFTIIYVPTAVVTHYSYSGPNEFKENQYVYSLINNLYLRLLYGSFKSIIAGCLLNIKAILNNNKPSGAENKETRNRIRHKLLYNFILLLFRGLYLVPKNIFYNRGLFKHEFRKLNYEIRREGAFFEVQIPDEDKLVSVIIRTCQRPQLLRETLLTLRNQTYRNFEIVIVEDGQNESEGLVKNEFADLNINYFSTNQKVGRSEAGNIGLERCIGEYINFLDDDDWFFADHIESLILEFQRNQDYKIVYSTAFETKVDFISYEPLNYKINQIKLSLNEKFSRLKLYKRNIFPIQSIMFKREVFKECGVFDPKLDALEDWDLWLRFAFKYNFLYTNKTTSLYKTPSNILQANLRKQKFIETRTYILNKYQAQPLSLYLEDIYNEFN